ncbi:MAG: hypothetical protein ACFE0P_02740 [Oceanicaulis sp.]
MANLPTAYASQRFGAKTLDFYAASGEVIGADPRARADERRLQDMDGARHTVRLMEARFDLEPGDQASVLRLQPGPARRSRPVAVVNHTRGGWTRTHPGANALVSRAGVARNVNWALTLGLFALAALACVWPYMIAFLAEIAPAAFSDVPAYDIFALAAAAAPGLTGWSWAEIAAPLAALLGEARPGLEGFAPALAFGAAVLAGAATVFAARSWRLLWAPLYVAALLAGAIGFAGPEAALAPALAGLGLASAVFLIGGAWNRISDAVRLESRIALLADHILSNAPEETVAGAAQDETADGDAPGEPAQSPDADALVDERTAVAVAATLRSLDGDDDVEDTAEAAEAETHDAQAPEQADTDMADEPAVSDARDETRDETMAEVLEAAEAAPLDEVAPQDEVAPEAEANPEPAAVEAAPAQDADETRDAELALEAETVEAGADEAGSHDEPEPADHADPSPEKDAVAASSDEDPADRGELTDDAAGEAARPDSPAPAGLDAEEAERLRTDPRYASRAIILPPPPPMPAPSKPAAPAREPAPQLETAGAPAAGGARTLNPGRPLPDNVVPIFAAPPPDKR